MVLCIIPRKFRPIAEILEELERERRPVGTDGWTDSRTQWLKTIPMGRLWPRLKMQKKWRFQPNGICSIQMATDDVHVYVRKCWWIDEWAEMLSCHFKLSILNWPCCHDSLSLICASCCYPVWWNKKKMIFRSKGWKSIIHILNMVNLTSTFWSLIHVSTRLIRHNSDNCANLNISYSYESSPLVFE